MRWTCYSMIWFFLRCDKKNKLRAKDTNIKLIRTLRNIRQTNCKDTVIMRRLDNSQWLHKLQYTSRNSIKHVSTDNALDINSQISQRKQVGEDLRKVDGLNRCSRAQALRFQIHQQGRRAKRFLIKPNEL